MVTACNQVMHGADTQRLENNFICGVVGSKLTNNFTRKLMLPSRGVEPQHGTKHKQSRRECSTRHTCPYILTTSLASTSFMQTCQVAAPCASGNSGVSTSLTSTTPSEMQTAIMRVMKTQAEPDNKTRRTRESDASPA